MKNPDRSFLKLALASVLSVSIAGQALAATARFKAYDSNGDGKITLDEYQAQGGQAPAFHEADSNRDNSLSPDELARTRTVPDRVQAGKYVDDAWITAKVKTMLLKDEGVKGLKVKVATRKGTVQLAGWVSDPMQIALAEKIARSVEGVTGVKNDLQVQH